MAKKSMVNREIKRAKLVEKFAEKRKSLKETIANLLLTDDERWEAQKQLQMLPRNASPTRLRLRCRVSGRPRGVYRKFGLGRNKLREAVMRGDVPGVRKASW